MTDLDTRIRSAFTLRVTNYLEEYMSAKIDDKVCREVSKIVICQCNICEMLSKDDCILYAVLWPTFLKLTV